MNNGLLDFPKTPPQQEERPQYVCFDCFRNINNQKLNNIKTGWGWGGNGIAIPYSFNYAIDTFANLPTGVITGVSTGGGWGGHGFTLNYL